METYQSIGFTKKTYGVKGEIKLNIADKYLEDLAQADVVFLNLAGRKIPHFVEYINFDNPFTIKFEDYNSKEAVVELTGVELFLRERDLLAEEEKQMQLPDNGMQYEEYVGFSIKDQTEGVLGEILEIIEYPQQEMALVKIGEKEVLIPLNDQLIIQILEKEKVIEMDLPEGLLHLDT